MILVSGATGILGGIITQRLLGEGKDVRILVRHNSPSEQMAQQNMATLAQSLIESGARPVYGDLKDRASLVRACDSVETVITTANSAMRSGEDNVDTVDRQGNGNLIEAAKAARVKQFIVTSFLGADPDSPVPLFQAKAESEAVLRASGMPTSQDFYAHTNYIDLWLSSHTNGSRPSPAAVDAMEPELISSPGLRSGKLYYPLELFSFVKVLKPLVIPLLPRDSHAWMNIDSPEQGFRFEYVMQASVKRTKIEFLKTVKELGQEWLKLFVDK